VLQDKRAGYRYETGMAGPGIRKEEKKEKKPKKGKQKFPNMTVQCGSCLKFDHSRRAHKDCGNTTFREKRK
jgi:hypothetical protein